MASTTRRPTRRSFIAATAGATLLPLLPAPAHAQAYPNKPIRLVVAFGSGSGNDIIARDLARSMGETLGQSIVVENRPGAGTLLGASQVAKSPADGYNLLVATTTTLAISPSMYATPPAVAADFVGVAMIGSVTLLLVTRPDLKVNNLAELVTAMRNEPGKFNFGSPGNGSMHHLIIEMIKSQEKVSATHVPYQGSLPALTDLMAGRLDFMFLDAVAGMPQIQANKVGVIAISASRRLAALPQVTTVAETYPKIDIQAWQAIAAPRDTPAPVVARLNAEINKMLEAPDVRATLLKSGVEANPMSVQALNDLIAVDNKRFGDLVRAAGVKAN